MASEDFSAALPASAHPMAKPGYGKRSAPDELPSRAGDFDHLPAREAYIAAYIDRLAEGAAIDVKTLAKELTYGQQAVGTALRALTTAGHYRRVREPLGEGLTQWVYRSYFSRTPRDNAWWQRLFDGDVPAEETEPTEPAPAVRSKAYDTLARVGRADARMALSAAECAALEGLAAQWLAHGSTPDLLLTALTAGLPNQVHSPGALARRRLTDKMPAALPPTRPRRVLVECTECGVPGLPEALPDGVCKGCQSPDTPAATARQFLPPDVVRHHTAALKSLSSLRYQTGTGPASVEVCLL